MALKQKTGRKGEGEMSFLEHLEELRWHIIRSVLAIFVLMIVAFILKNIIFDKIILAPKSPEFFTNRILCQLGHAKIFGHQLNIDALCINTRQLNLINIRMAGQLTTHILVALVSGLIMAFPVIIYEFWMFFKPALHENEARYTKGAVFSTTMLFFSGVLFGYYLLAPLSIHFLGSYHVSDTVENQIYIRSYISTIASICLATGVIFELPVIAFFLTKIGVLTPEFMRKYRRHSIVVIFILAAVITPPDVFSQMLVGIPLLILYEVSIGISGRVIRKKEKEHKAFMKEDAIEKAQDAAI